MRFGTKITLLVVAILACLGGLYSYQKVSSNAELLGPTLIAKQSGSAPATTASGTPGGNTRGVATTQPAVATAQSCAPATLASAPIVPDLTVVQPGLHETPLRTSYYTIFGNTLEQIRQQAFSCSPIIENGSRFSANTSYSINWAYDFLVNENNLCVVTNARVGLGIVQQYPSWQPTAASAPGLSGTWQAYMADLVEHEMDHANLNRSYAATLHAHLQNFPPTDCSTIAGLVSKQAQADIAALNAANASFDTNTSHGATQGAVL